MILDVPYSLTAAIYIPAIYISLAVILNVQCDGFQTPASPVLPLLNPCYQFTTKDLRLSNYKVVIIHTILILERNLCVVCLSYYYHHFAKLLHGLQCV